MNDISVVIVSYNTEELTKKCIESLVIQLEQTDSVSAEIIVIDNGSTDGSVEMLEKMAPTISKKGENIELKILKSDKNLGFSKANNLALKQANGKYILFLNSDVYVKHVNFEDLIYYLNKNPEVGALTVRVLLPSGKIDWASHRGNPTLWRALTYFSKLEKIFAHVPKFSKIFGGYHLKHLDLDTIHEIDSPSGAFYLTRKDILDKTGGFDTRYFMYGEDLDLSHRIKKMGYKIIYFPLFTVLHYKYKSGLKRGIVKTEVMTKNYFYDAMKLFYEKHFASKNIGFINKLVYFFINFKKRI